MRFKDYYQILGLASNASADEIKKAYRKLARQFHPDRSKEKNAEERFKEINEAHEALGDEKRRAQYDQLRASGLKPGDEIPMGGAGFDSAGMGDFSDLFESLFRQHGAGPRARPRRGRDIEARVEIDLETAYRGGSQRISFETREGTRTFDVRIPAGVVNGQVIRLAGGGDSGTSGTRGDLLLKVELLPHARYQLRERDLYVELPLMPWQAALGDKVKLDTLQGEVELGVPAGSQSGRKLRLRERGWPGEPPGDLYVQLKVDTPSIRSDADRAFYQSMREHFQPSVVSHKILE